MLRTTVLSQILCALTVCKTQVSALKNGHEPGAPAFWVASRTENLLRGIVIPAENAESAQGVPAAGAADGGFHLEGNKFGMTKVERPASVLVATLDYNFDRFADAAVGFDSGVAQIVESAQDVVVPEGWVRETEPALVDDFSGAKRAEQVAIEEIFFGALAGLGDFLRHGVRGGGFASGSFVFKQAFEDADGAMEGRTRAFRSFAIPATIVELFA
jgi:hypothetical protein